MTRLYWKIFFWFWITIVITIVITALLTTQFSRRSINTHHHANYINTIAAATNIVLNAGDEKALLQWFRFLNQKKGVKLFLINTQQGKIKPHTMPTKNLNDVLHHIKQKHAPNKTFEIPPYFVSHTLSTSQGKQFRIIAKPPPKFIDYVQFQWATIILRLIVAVLISAFVCYFLSIYLTGPIRSLKKAAIKIGEGKFSTRVGTLLTHRKDEIGSLALEFDHMADRLENLIHARQRLLHDISHELRSPLARLMVALEIARNKVGERAEQELNRIEKESNCLNELIASILSLTSLNIEKESIHKTNISLIDVIQEIINDANFENQSQKQRVSFEANITSLTLEANQSLIASAIENIIRNAMRYSPQQEKITVHLSVNESDVNITIKDHGPGIPEDKMQYIFDPFYRVDEARNKRVGGFGLGLAIANKAIKLHGGVIEAQNRVGGGLSINIHLPLNPNKQ